MSLLDLQNFPQSLKKDTLKVFEQKRKDLLNHILDGASFVDVLHDSKHGLFIEYERKNHKFLIMFHRSRQKPTFWFRYKDEEQLNFRKERQLKELKSQEEYEIEKKSKQSKGHADIQIGDIFVSQWGYSMTLVDFYQVIDKVGKSTLVLREIQQERISDGYLSGRCTPIKDSFVGREIKKRYNNECVKINDSSRARKVKIETIAGVTIVPSFYYNHCD